MSRLSELFDDSGLVVKVREKLPSLFHIAEQESSRAGKVGMEVGSKREQIITALLMYKFGEGNVARGPINEPDVDIRLFSEPVSIKTFTSKNPTSIGSVKVIWTVDWQRVEAFLEGYQPRSDMVIVQICWGDEGGLYLVPSDLQQDTFHELGRDTYLKIPPHGTNPRGIEISPQALRTMLNTEERTRRIPIQWERPGRSYDPDRRWLEYWER